MISGCPCMLPEAVGPVATAMTAEIIAGHIPRQNMYVPSRANLRQRLPE